MLDEGTSRLIAEIYAGAHDRATWDRAVADMCGRLSAHWMMIAPFDEQQRTPIVPAYYQAPGDRFEDAVAEYVAETFRIDPTNRFALSSPAGGTFDSHMIRNADDYRRHPYVRWNRARFGNMFWRFRYSGRDGYRLGVSVHSRDGDGPMRGRRAALFDLLFAHMDAATRLAARPPALDGPEAVVLLDGFGRIVAASDAAARLLARGDAVRASGRRLAGVARRSARMLDAAIRSALSVLDGGSSGGAATLERADGPPLLATVTPLPVPDGPFPELRAAAMVRIIDPVDRSFPGADWRALFGFTPAETRVAAALLTGDGNLRDTAERLGIAYATARVQLASLFDKAGVRSQVQLVRLLGRLEQ